MVDLTLEDKVLENSGNFTEGDLIDTYYEDFQFVDEESQYNSFDEFLNENSFRLVYLVNSFLLPQIVSMVKDKATINLHPEYQRRMRWDNKKKSKLIESLLLNIPIPSLFFFETKAAMYEVVDGQQRLNAISEFFSNKLILNGLEIVRPLNGLSFANCPSIVLQQLERSTISATTLLMESDMLKNKSKSFTKLDARRILFDRLNTGGQKLNPQEIRNAIYGGNFNNALIELSRDNIFTTIFNIPPYETNSEGIEINLENRQNNNLFATMKDCELVLRYFALKDEKNIKGSIKAMLDRKMERLKDISKEKSEQLIIEYKTRLEFLFELFKAKPFQISSGKSDRKRVSAGLYEASMVAIDKLWKFKDNILANQNQVIDRLEKATQNEEDRSIIVGRRSIKGRESAVQAVHDRINLVKNIMLPE